MNIGRDIPENILIAGLQSASNPYKLINFLNLRLWQDPCKQIVGVALLPMLCNATFPNCRAVQINHAPMRLPPRSHGVPPSVSHIWASARSPPAPLTSRCIDCFLFFLLYTIVYRIPYLPLLNRLEGIWAVCGRRRLETGRPIHKVCPHMHCPSARLYQSV